MQLIFQSHLQMIKMSHYRENKGSLGNPIRLQDKKTHMQVQTPPQPATTAHSFGLTSQGIRVALRQILEGTRAVFVYITLSVHVSAFTGVWVIVKLLV